MIEFASTYIPKPLVFIILSEVQQIMAMSRTPHDIAAEFLGGLKAADDLQEFLARGHLPSKSSVEYTLRSLDRRMAEDEVRPY